MEACVSLQYSNYTVNSDILKKIEKEAQSSRQINAVDVDVSIWRPLLDIIHHSQRQHTGYMKIQSNRSIKYNLHIYWP